MMRTKTSANLTATVENLSRYNWFTVIVKAEDKEPRTFHATGISVHMDNFLEFHRLCATSGYTDNVIVEVSAINEWSAMFLTASGTTYTVEAYHEPTIADRNTAQGKLDNLYTLIDWHRSKATESGDAFVVLDFCKAKNLSVIQEARIERFMNAYLGGLCQSYQVCRTIFIEALNDDNKSINVGIYSLEQEKPLTQKLYYADWLEGVLDDDEKYRAEVKATKRLIQYVWNGVQA